MFTVMFPISNQMIFYGYTVMVYHDSHVFNPITTKS